MAEQARLLLHCRGAVQGVGFRPFLHRLASQLALTGEVENVAGSVRVELHGEQRTLRHFLGRLSVELPVPGTVGGALKPSWLPPLPTRPSGLRIAAAPSRPAPCGARLRQGKCRPAGPLALLVAEPDWVEPVCRPLDRQGGGPRPPLSGGDAARVPAPHPAGGGLRKAAGGHQQEPIRGAAGDRSIPIRHRSGCKTWPMASWCTIAPSLVLWTTRSCR